MQIASRLAGFSLGKADVLRKAMGKKSTKLMQTQKETFIQGCLSNSIPKETAIRVFDLIYKFAGYGFNKSHATCYSIIAYHTAYLKAHHPMEFMAANLTSEMGNSDRIVILIDECHRMGINVLPPDVNESSADFIVTTNGIRFGMGAIKNVGRGAIHSITDVRKEAHRFKTLYDFCEKINLRLVNKKVIESLIQSGAMDSLEGSRSQKMAIATKASNLAQSAQQRADLGQTTMFEGEESSNELYPDLPDIESWSQSEILNREKEVLGFYISGHPLTKYEEEVKAFSRPRIKNLSETDSGQTVRLCGIITDVKNLLDRKNNQMAFFRLEDFSENIRVIVFSEPFQEHRPLIQNDQMVVVTGTLDRKDDSDEVTLLATHLLPLEKARAKLTKRIALNIDTRQITDDKMDKLKMIFEKFPGSCRLYLNITTENGNELLVRSNRYEINPTLDFIHNIRQIIGKENAWIEG
jgi:DNA polymerase-3 subunit alpha